jgi:histidine triad (HIT) family protein
VPVKHIVSVNDLGEKDASMIGRLILLARRLAEEEHVAKSGYRLVINCGSEGGQVVPHLHLHLIGGTRLNDRMG